MRYPSLRLIVFLYHVIAVVGALSVFVLSIIFATGAIEFLHRLFPNRPLALENYAAVLAAPFGFFLAGMFGALCVYAFGTLLTVIMDIEANTRQHQYQEYQYAEEDVPVAPRPMASFPRSPVARPQRQTGDERAQAARRHKWDMGR